VRSRPTAQNNNNENSVFELNKRRKTTSSLRSYSSFNAFVYASF
jgi:hypothetical protein